VIFRLRDPVLCNQIFTEVIAPYLADTLKTRVLMPDGEYVRLHEARRLAHLRNGHRFNVQEFLIDFIEGRQALDSVPPGSSFFKFRPSHPSNTESA